MDTAALDVPGPKAIDTLVTPAPVVNVDATAKPQADTSTVAMVRS